MNTLRPLSTLPILSLVLLTPGLAQRSADPSLAGLRFESPPAAPPAQVPGCSCGARPGPRDVYLHSGEFHHEVEDLRVPGRGPDFVWARKYRSRLGPVTALGNCWDFSYNICAERRGPHVVVHDGNTRSDLYRRGPDDLFVAEELFREGRFPLGDPETFVLTFADRSIWIFRPFDDPQAPGKIASIADRHGNTLSFSYDALGRLSSIRDTLGRDVVLGYGADGLLKTVTDFTGRQVSYQHYTDMDAGGSFGDLKSATSPAVTGTPFGNDFPAGKTTVYTYSKGFTDVRLNHNLLTITDPKGQTMLGNDYSPSTDPDDAHFDTLVSQERGDPGDVEAYEIQWGVMTGDEGNPGDATRRRVIVNDRMGNVSEFLYDVRGRCEHVRRYTGRAIRNQPTTDTTNRPMGKLRSTDPDWFDTRFEYNADGRRRKIVHANGNVTRRWHAGDDDPTVPSRERGNLVKVRRRPGSHTPVGDQPVLEETLEWKPGFGACCGEEFVTRHVDARGNETTHTYDALGNRLQTTHELPSSGETFEYNSFGQLTAHTHPDHGEGVLRRDEFHYYGVGHGSEGYLMEEVVDVAQLALTTVFEYDARGNVTRRIDPRGNDSVYQWNQLDQLVCLGSRRVTPLGGFSPTRYRQYFFFDANDNITDVWVENIDELGALQPNQMWTTSYEYDTLNFLVRETREVQAGQTIVTEFERDRNENLARRRWGEATNGNQPTNTVTMLYDERDLLFQIVRAEGDPDQSTEQRDYDGNGNLVRRHRGLEDQPRVTEVIYDAFDRRIATRDAMGNEEDVTFDPNGNVVTRVVLGELGDVPGDAANIRLLQESTTFDAMNRPVQIVEHHFDPVTQMQIGDGMSNQTLWWSDASQLLGVQDDNGNVTEFEFDTAHRLRVRTDAKGNMTTFDRDENGNVTAVVELELSDTGQTPQIFVTTRVFDEEDRIVEVLDNADNSTVFGYDSRDNQTRRIDALGNVRAMTFDGLSRRTATTRFLTDDGTGNGAPIGEIVTTEAWDDSSRRVGRGDDHGNVQQLTYDALNRVVSETCADGTLLTRTFDVHDNPVTRSDANGTGVTRTFDLLNRQTTTTVMPGAGVSSDTTFEAFAYDGLSRLVQAQDDDSTVVRRHDSLSNLVSETQNGRELTAAFDGMGNRLACAYPGGRSLSCAFDALNRMTSIADTQTLATWEYFGPRRVERRTQPMVDVTSLFTHDSIRRIVGMDHIGTAAPVDQRTFEWDAVHNKVESADLISGLTSQFTYDSAYRLGRALVLGALGPVRDTTYSFDDVNNRESVTGDPDWSGGYVLDPTLPAPGDFQANQYTDTPCDARTYDANGNLAGIVGAAGSATLTYDFRNRMVSYGPDATYGYDPLGRRIRKTVVDSDGSPVTTEYLYDEWNVCEERDGTDAVLRTFVYGAHIDEVLNMRSGADVHFCGDDQGSIRVALEPGVGVVCSYTYGDYGKPSFFDGAGNQLSASATGNPYLFTGRRFDAESGLYYYRTRYMDPGPGRFTTRDTIGIWGDENNLGNGFAYVGNNPQTALDPFGLSSSRQAWYDKHAHISALINRKKGYEDIFIKWWFTWDPQDENRGVWTDHGDPNPEGGASGIRETDAASLMDKLKKIGGRWEDEQNIYSTPLGHVLESHGATLLPHVNPVPIDFGYEWEGGGGGMGLNAGGIREDMERKKRQGKGNDNNDTGDDGGDKPPDDARTGYYWDIGPSELVNPHDHGMFRMSIPVQIMPAIPIQI